MSGARFLEPILDTCLISIALRLRLCYGRSRVSNISTRCRRQMQFSRFFENPRPFSVHSFLAPIRSFGIKIKTCPSSLAKTRGSSKTRSFFSSCLSFVLRCIKRMSWLLRRLSYFTFETSTPCLLRLRYLRFAPFIVASKYVCGDPRIEYLCFFCHTPAGRFSSQIDTTITIP